MGGQVSGSSGQLRNNGDYGSLDSAEIQEIYNLKIKAAKLITIPLKKGMNWVNMGFDYFYYGLIPFTPFKAKFVHTALDLILENNTSIVIEYGCYLTKSSDLSLFTNITGYREPDMKRINYYYPFQDGISFYIIKIDDLRNFYGIFNDFIEENIRILYQNASDERIQQLILYEVTRYNLFNIYANLYNTTLKESIQELILHMDRNQIYHFDFYIKNEMTFGDLIDKFSNGWTAVDYNVVTHNCQDFVGKVIEILKAYRPLEITRQLLYEIELPRVVVNALKDNESEERTTTEFKVRRVLEKIPLINLYIVYKHHSGIREDGNAIDN